MFTGIVEEIGEVADIQRKGSAMNLRIQCAEVMGDLSVGDSVAVNGLCLTAEEVEPAAFSAGIMPESVRHSTLGDLRVGSKVNLERAIAAGERFGGHLVSGHIDGVGRVRSRRPEDNAQLFVIEVDPGITESLVEKGSVTVDGVSLSITGLERGSFSVSIIPHTIQHTTLRDLRSGGRVNVEADLIGKYVAKFVSGLPSGDDLTADALRDKGFK